MNLINICLFTLTVQSKHYSVQGVCVPEYRYRGTAELKPHLNILSITDKQFVNESSMSVINTLRKNNAST